MGDSELEVVKKGVSQLVFWASSLQVTTADDYKVVVERLRTIKGLRNRCTGYWKDLKEKAHGTWKDIIAKEKLVTDQCDYAGTIAKGKAIAWKQEADRKVQEEQRRLQAEADERARKEQERLLKRAETLKTPEKQDEARQAAAEVITPVVAVASPTVDVEGASSRKRWKAELTDKITLIFAAKPNSNAESLLEFNQKAAGAFARATKGTVPVPGVKFYEVEDLAVRKQ